MRKVYLMIVVLLLTGCGEQSTKVGVIAPFTGDFANYGEDIRRGMVLAIDTLEAEGQNFEIIYEDACLPKDALAAAKKVVYIDGVEFISGAFCIISIIPISTITETEQMSVMSVSPMPDNVLDAGKNIFSINIASKDEAIAMAEFAFHELNARTASIIHYETDLGVSYQENFIQAFEKLGGAMLDIEQVKLSGSDYRTELQKVSRGDPDVILAVHIGTQLGVILQQAERLDIDSQILSFFAAENQVVIDVAQDAAEGFIISVPGQVEKTQTQHKFEKQFVNAFGEKPTIVAMNAYDSLLVQTKAYDACDGKRSCMYNYITNLENYEGVSGTFSIGTDGTAMKGFYFKQVQDGKFLPLIET